MPSTKHYITSVAKVDAAAGSSDSLRLHFEGCVRPESLFQPLTEAETKLFQDAVHGESDPHHKLKEYKNIETGYIDSIQRQSMRQLQPGKWLNNEIITYYF